MRVSRIAASASDEFNAGAVPDGRGELSIARQQRRRERFGQRHASGVVDGTLLRSPEIRCM